MSSRMDHQPDARQSDDWAKMLNNALELPLSHFGRQDLALLNLLCAPSLPGNENLDIAKCLARVDHLAEFVKASTERNLHRFRSDPDYGHCEPMWRMAMLVTLVKRDFGATYDPSVKVELEANLPSLFTDSRNVFLHGLLDDDRNRRWGSCSSIPVLVAAVARRLGYPVGLAVNRKHVYVRWDNLQGFSFNIEASNPAGMATPTDQHYREFPLQITQSEEQSGFYLRSLHPAEEFGMFCMFRVWCLQDAARYAETMLWSARALQFAPDEPHFANIAYSTAMEAIKQRYRNKYLTRFIPPPERNHEFYFVLGEFLTIEERSTFLTIAAHHAEATGEIDRARQAYIEAARQNFHGNNEQRDLQRFLRTHGWTPPTGPRVMPKNIGQPRRVRLSCPPEQEADELRNLVIQCERAGQYLKARDALHDLYLFDPCDTEVFRRARLLEKHPVFQTQLKSLIAERRRVLNGTERTAGN